eukprot:ANDGO_06178.mRNA.1 AdoMet-dependent rRNA methyltransferase spb1
MGKQGKKTGKERLDKYYVLAKEQGFRARSAFKLIQLNKKFDFLNSARVCIDLCAAPGGWMQVAQKYMPVSSLIIGVDLVPIKPIKNVITLVEDITTEKCRTAIRKELKTWNADVVLHDGAPNMGTTWVSDAFTQADLVLCSLKLACEFLRPGGTFVSKVFRSKDYNSLIWVFQQLFKKVHATKPASSRAVSAEIFVVCQDFICPKKIDPKLFDIKHVFEDVEENKPHTINEKQKRNREGYEEGATLLFKEVSFTDFVLNDSPAILLATINRISVSDEEKEKYASVFSTELFELFKDVRVLGKRDLKAMLKSRLKAKKLMQDSAASKKSRAASAVEEIEVEEEEDALDSVNEKLREFREKEAKRKRKEEKRERDKKLKQKARLGGMTNDDMDTSLLLDTYGDASLFAAATKSGNVNLDPVSDEDVDDSIPDDEEPLEWESDDEDYHDLENDLDRMYQMYKARKMNAPAPLEDGSAGVVSTLPKPAANGVSSNRWFSSNFFDVADMSLPDKQPVSRKRSREQAENDSDADSDEISESDSDSDSASDSEDDGRGVISRNRKVPSAAKDDDDSDGEFEEVPIDQKAMIMAIGKKMLKKKNRMDMIDAAYNRYAFDDLDAAPAWFRDSEEIYSTAIAPVTKTEILAEKAKFQELNSRPIKKVAEAKARKHHHLNREVNKLRDKTSGILENSEMSASEKSRALDSLYKKANSESKNPKKLKRMDGTLMKEMKANKRKESRDGPKKKRSKTRHIRRR